MVRTRVGYAGGRAASPTYHRLGDHTETIEIEFDPTVITYEELLEVFWRAHDPTARAWSRQYRSVILVADDRQWRIALASRQRQAARVGRPVATAIEGLGEFTPAEDYHQKYRLRSSGALFETFRTLYPDPDRFRDSTAAARVNGILGGYGTLEGLGDELERYGLSPEDVAMLRHRLETNRRGKGGGS